jgi:ATP-dependent RNA helicase DHX36
MKNDGVEKFLQKAMDPPPEEAVAFAMDRLKKLGAIQVDDTRFGGEMLTPLGRCLSRLPLDPGIGRMLIMGCTMQNLDPVLTAAACFSSRDPFYTPPGMRDEARIIRQSFSETSDLMATVRAYDEFQNTIRQDGWDAARRWASENFVSVVAMNSIQSVRSQLLGELNKIGLVSKRDLINFRSKVKMLHYDAEVNQNAGCDMLDSAVWATGLPGNLSARHHSGNFGAIRTRTEQQAGLHPSSVAFYRQPPKNVKLPKWYFYHEMVLSSEVFLRGCTAIQPEQVMLFGGYSMDSPQLSASSSPINADRPRAMTKLDANRFISDDLFSTGMDNENENLNTMSDRNQKVLDDWVRII